MDCLDKESEKLEQAIAAFREYRDRAGRDGIGRLGEKSMHGILKFYLDPNFSHHEIPLPEGTVADVFDGETVTEIQTGNYLALQKKLPRVLPNYRVHVVCPIVRDRYLYTVDEESGAVDGGRKSPLHGGRSSSLVAMAYLDRFLEDAHFTVTFLLLDTADYRMRTANGQKRARYRKLDRVPICVVNTWSVIKREDYQRLLPPDLPQPFTAAEFNKAMHLRGRNGSVTLKFLRECGTVKQIGSRGRAYLYTIETD